MRYSSSKKSSNGAIMKKLISNTRRMNLPFDVGYVILYSFLYKYCSDNIREHILLEIRDKELTLDEAYKNNSFHVMISEDIMKLFGFNFKTPDAFMDEVINTYFSDDRFFSKFFTAFPENIVFSEEYCDEKYFRLIFKTIEDTLNFEKYDEDSEIKSSVKEIIRLISELDIYDMDYPFEDVFDVISFSRMIHVESNPEYVSQILANIIACQKESVYEFYDPFIKDGSNLFAMFNTRISEVGRVYGKDMNNFNSCFLIVKLFINGFSLDDLFLKQEDALESADFNGKSFDAIVSSIPVSIKNYHSANKNQSFEIVKRNKRSELEEVLLKFGIDKESFTKDSELNNTLENLVEKIDLASEYDAQFSEEYESLRDSEFLFLINLIDSLKDDGIMAISIPQNFLFKDSLTTLRKYLTLEKNYIDAIISIPNEFDRYKMSEVVIVFKKNRLKRDILFIDMSKDYGTRRNRKTFPRVFKRNFVLDQITIDKMCDVIIKRETIEKFSNVVSLDEIMQKKFNLSVYKYVDTFNGEFVRLSELSRQKEEIESNISKLNLKIEKMMDELDIRL